MALVKLTTVAQHSREAWETSREVLIFTFLGLQALAAQCVNGGCSLLYGLSAQALYPAGADGIRGQGYLA